jgi:hypothetical protein
VFAVGPGLLRRLRAVGDVVIDWTTRRILAAGIRSGDPEIARCAGLGLRAVRQADESSDPTETMLATFRAEAEARHIVRTHARAHSRPE